MRSSLIVFALLFVSPRLAAADIKSTDNKVAKPKATVASITTKRDTLISVRDKLRELAAQKEPEKLSPDHKKAYAQWVTALKSTADKADALATKLTDGLKDKSQKNLDSMSEMGEMESLRLQMAMDRESKMISTLSNIMKKNADTAQTITQNLK